MNTKEASRKEYIARINRVMDYVETHLDEPLDLQCLAQVAHFSPFHFHRIFATLVGETLNVFLRRIRLEKAACLLIGDLEMPIQDIATRCGFSSQPVFARAFRKHFGKNASEFRILKKEELSKIYQTQSKKCKVPLTSNGDLCFVTNKNLKMIMKTEIEAKQMPGLDLIYCRHTGAFDQIKTAYEKLMQWAGPHGLLRFPETKTVTVYHDDPNITAIEKLRQSACITVTEDVKTDGEIGKMHLPAGLYAVGRFEIKPIKEEFEEAYKQMCIWLTDSGYLPADGYPYELYHTEHTQHPEGKFVLDICLPVKPL